MSRAASPTSRAGRKTSTSPSPSPPQPAVTLYAHPCDVTLVKHILQPWVTSGDTKPGGAYVHAADLYSADPEELARRFPPAVSVAGGGDCTWYFLSPLRNKSPRDKRKVRAVADGTGCWHSEAAPRNVVDHVDGGRHVGYRQSFSFMRRGDAGGVDVRAGWIMAEFHLHNEGLGRKVQGLVLCKMYRSPRNHGPTVVPDSGDDVRSRIVSSLSAETILSLRKSKAAVDDEVPNAMTPRWQRQHRRNSDGVAMATATEISAPLVLQNAAGDDQVSSVTTAVAPCAKNKAVAVHDEDLLVSPPARKKMRMAVADAESSGAAALALEAMSTIAPAAAAPNAGSTSQLCRRS